MISTYETLAVSVLGVSLMVLGIGAWMATVFTALDPTLAIDPSLALTLLTHPFQVAMMVVALGAIAREIARATARGRRIVGTKSRPLDANVPAAA